MYSRTQTSVRSQACQGICVKLCARPRKMRQDPKERQTQTCGAPGGVRMSHQISQLMFWNFSLLSAQFQFLIHSLCTPEAVLLLDSLSCIRRLFCIQRICRFGFTRKLVKPDPRLSRTICDFLVFICLDMGLEYNFAVSRGAGYNHPE